MSGYVDCPCCGETIVGEPGDLCGSCTAASCEASDGDDCQIPKCPDCETRASFMNDRKWHSNCDAPCPGAGKAWAE